MGNRLKNWRKGDILCTTEFERGNTERSYWEITAVGISKALVIPVSNKGKRCRGPEVLLNPADYDRVVRMPTSQERLLQRVSKDFPRLGWKDRVVIHNISGPEVSCYIQRRPVFQIINGELVRIAITSSKTHSFYPHMEYLGAEVLTKDPFRSAEKDMKRCLKSIDDQIYDMFVKLIAESGLQGTKHLMCRPETFLVTAHKKKALVRYEREVGVFLETGE